MRDILVIGGGAAGLIAAYSAAMHGAKVTVAEKMPVCGRKLLITGKGRCNITNVCDVSGFVNNIHNGQFLHSSFREFSNQDVIDFLGQYGLATKVERGGRIFPDSDQAGDVVECLLKALQHYSVEIITNFSAQRILAGEGAGQSVVVGKDGRRLDAKRIILTTGGASYPGTGSTGDGYKMAQALGHTIVPLAPALVPLEVEEDWARQLQGLSLRNVTATILHGGKKVQQEFGEMLFTHFGVSGPIILSLSRTVSKLLADAAHQEVTLDINLKPALDAATLDRRLQRDFTEYARKQLKNGLGDLMPERLIHVVMDLAFLDPETPVHQITREQRLGLGRTLQCLPLTVTKVRPLAEAIVTAGGVHVKEINPKTMESKLVPGLYLAGEVIDIDGYTGGYNLQAAFSSGFVAGKYAAQVI